jgi:hypothetical protein
MTEPGTDLIQRTTLEELIGWRGRAIALAEAARVQQLATMQAIKDAVEAAARAAGGHAPFHKMSDYVEHHHGEPEKFAANVRRDLDRAMWQHLLRISGIEGLMDETGLRDFQQQLASEPPEIDVGTVQATFQQFKADAYTIFRRGLVNAFRNLDRTYRSHDGFKIGNRMVRSYALSDYGSLYDSIPALRDVDRIMHLLDGSKIVEGWSSPLTIILDRAVRGSHSFGIQPGSVTTEYWHVKWFKNRNMHLHPLRKDLVRRANLMIAEHCGEAVGEGPDAAGARRYQRAKPYHSTVEDFYPTPAPVVAQMLAAAELQPDHAVLEPSAGDGAIARVIFAKGIVPDCVEIDFERATELRDLLPLGAVINMDFLSMNPDPEYDRVVMNPPFGKGAGVQHVFHALRFLKPGGRLVAVLGAGLDYREDGPSRELRSLIRQWNGTIMPLPAASFSPVGTSVETVLIVVSKPGEATLALAPPANQTLFAVAAE